MRRWIAFVLCLIGVCLPWRLRVWYGKALGWWAQGVYWIYTGLLKMIVKGLKAGKGTP